MSESPSASAESSPEPSASSVRITLYAIFLLSGIAGLIYEVVWTRQLLLVFGSTSFAVGTVLASFMGGLALGSVLLGRRADRTADCLFLYAVLEIVIGAYGIASPFLVRVVEAAYGSLHAALDPSFPVSISLRLLLAGAFIVVPTALMGGTLPVLVRFVTAGGVGRATNVGGLYAVNTAGAVVGVLLAGIWLLPLLGVKASLAAAGILNLLAGFFALRLRKAGGAPAVAAAAETAPAPAPLDSSIARWILPAMALSGCATFLYEVTWTRTLHMIVGSTHDALTVVLAGFLVGIAAGSAMISRHADRTSAPAHLFLGLEWGIAVLGLLVIPLLGELPFLLIAWHDFLGANHSRFVAFKFLVSMLSMIVPTLLIGATFPVAARLYLGGTPDVGGRLGRLYLWNTLGAVAGALGGAFLCIPFLGSVWTSRLAACINGLAGLIVVFAATGKTAGLRWGTAVAGSLAALFLFAPGWSRHVVTSGPYMYAYVFKDMSRAEIRRTLEATPLIYDREGIDSVVTVREAPNMGRSLQINGKTEASTAVGQTDALVLLTEVPVQLHPSPSNALVIGWGLGISAGRLTCHDFIREIDVVELERAVLGATDLFKEFNHDAINHPRVKVHINDGRNFIALTKKKYDLVISDAPDCWVTGPSHLFTYEHLLNVKKVLNPGGILSQWVALGSLQDMPARSLLRTYAEVFRYVSVWETNVPREDIILASDSPMVLDARSFGERLKQPQVRADLERLGLADVAAFAARRVGEIPKSAWENAPLNTDDLPVLEFTPRINFFHPLNPYYAHEWLMEARGFEYTIAVTGIGREDWAGFLRSLAEHLNADNDRLAAIRVYAILAAEYPADPGPRARQAELWLDVGRPDHAAAAALEGLKSSPDHTALNFALGQALYTQGRLEDAVAPLRKANVDPPPDPQARLLLGRCFLLLKRADEARPLLEKFLENSPENPDALTSLALVWEEKGDREKALRYATAAEKVESRPSMMGAVQALLTRLRLPPK